MDEGKCAHVCESMNLPRALQRLKGTSVPML